MAAAGNLDAMHMLGESLYKGTNGFKQSSQRAYGYFARSKTIPKSALRLGLMHLHGNGAKQDDNIARSYFEAAVNMQSRRGDALLATMYMDGRSTARDYTKALFFANRSAYSGDTIGVVTLGTLYSWLGLGFDPGGGEGLAVRARCDHARSLLGSCRVLMHTYFIGTSAVSRATFRQVLQGARGPGGPETGAQAVPYRGGERQPVSPVQPRSDVRVRHRDPSVVLRGR